MNRTKRTFLVLAMALLAVLLGMSVRVSFDWLKLFGSARIDAEREALAGELAASSDPLEVFTKVAKFVGPSVVSIKGEGDVQTIFGDERHEQAGTGIIVDTEGHVLTNYHVVEGVDKKLVVELASGRRYRARVRGGNGEADLAVLELDGRPDAPPVVFGDSDAIEVGQSAIAIGNAFELRGTVTHGIISAKARPVGVMKETGPVLDNFIQTDAPINPGNSGGPLVDIHGKVIGINTLIYSNSGTSAGVGFAIPINYAKEVMRQLLETGHFVRGGIGIERYVQDAPDSTAHGGVRIRAVHAGSPADQAGIEPDDKIVELDGRPIRSFGDLKGIVSTLEVGRRTSVKVQRGRRVVTLPITIGALEKISRQTK